MISPSDNSMTSPRHTSSGREVLRRHGERWVLVTRTACPELAARMARVLNERSERMGHSVKHGCLHGVDDDQPPFRVLTPAGAVFARCYGEEPAERVAKALDLLDATEANPAVVIIPEDEILTRAREAAIAETDLGRHPSGQVRCGDYDDQPEVRGAIRALRDLAKPIGEIVPAVDPDWRAELEALVEAAADERWTSKGYRAWQSASDLLRKARP